MDSFSFNSNAIAEEIAQFHRKVQNGLHTLQQIGDVHVAESDRSLILRDNNFQLFRYTPIAKPADQAPVLIVYALINRPYILDLQPDRSFIRRLLEQGLDVYLIDWGSPDRVDQYLTLDDYINGFLRRSVDTMRKTSSREQINLVGVCQGGILALCYAAQQPDTVRNLITLVAPIDFSPDSNLAARLIQHVDIDSLVDAYGNVPGNFMNAFFLSLNPVRLLAKKYLDIGEILQDQSNTEFFLRMEKWIYDSPDLAGAAFREFAQRIIQENRLHKGTLTLGGHTIDTKKICMPVLNVYAAQDNIAPPASCKALNNIIGSTDYTELEYEGGHVGVYVSSRAQKRIPAALSTWLADR